MPRVDSTVPRIPHRSSLNGSTPVSPRTASPTPLHGIRSRLRTGVAAAALATTALLVPAGPALSQPMPEPSPSGSVAPSIQPALITCPGLLTVSGQTEIVRVDTADPTVTLTAGRSTAGGQVSVDGLAVTYTAAADYKGEDYIPVTGTNAEDQTGSCEITVKVGAAPTPSPEPTDPPTPEPSPEPTPAPSESAPGPTPAPTPTAAPTTSPEPQPTAPSAPAPSTPNEPSAPAPSAPGSTTTPGTTPVAPSGPSTPGTPFSPTVPVGSSTPAPSVPGLGVLAPTVLESWGTAPGAAPGLAPGLLTPAATTPASTPGASESATVTPTGSGRPPAAPDTVITETPQDAPEPQAASQDRASETTSSTMLWIVPALLLTAPTVWLAGLWLRRRRV